LAASAADRCLGAPAADSARQRIIWPKDFEPSAALAQACVNLAGAVADAAYWGHELLAIWIARELTRERSKADLRRLRLIILWAWFSLQTGTRGYRIAAKSWHPAMRFASALDAAEDWREKVALHVHLGGAPLTDMWVQPGCVDGYEFVPLNSAETIAEEATRMKNCLCTYGRHVAHNRTRFWSIRRGAHRVATLRVTKAIQGPLLTLRELRAAQNKQAPVEIWWAATRWLHQHDLSRIDIQQVDWETAQFDACAWRQLWRPYWLAKRRIPSWLPLKPSYEALWAL
jgi:hypothetical protein